MTTDERVLREDDPQTVRLLADGWVVVHESWGARLTVPEDSGEWGTRLEACVDAVRKQGWTVSRLGERDARSIVDLDGASIADYPDGGPATSHAVPDEPTLRRRLAGEWHAYGARTPDGRLDCVTVMRPEEDRVETEFTVTRARYRGQGLATAVKAYAILDQQRQGTRSFGTGGSAVNEASLRINEVLGYVLEPRWLTLRRP
ncbi:hypothetical protein [Cellulomonas sp. URHD0024]|uniref:hypothetical protein n=1 Tax=Cellulomonas sp. URHD0024 TaxID=1302620 RepID=UPI0003FFF791|nr:hypothetical protein [Cellulomonas sp. URHD0024]